MEFIVIYNFELILFMLAHENDLNNITCKTRLVKAIIRLKTDKTKTDPGRDRFL